MVSKSKSPAGGSRGRNPNKFFDPDKDSLLAEAQSLAIAKAYAGRLALDETVFPNNDNKYIFDAFNALRTGIRPEIRNPKRSLSLRGAWILDFFGPKIRPEIGDSEPVPTISEENPREVDLKDALGVVRYKFSHGIQLSLPQKHGGPRQFALLGDGEEAGRSLRGELVGWTPTISGLILKKPTGFSLDATTPAIGVDRIGMQGVATRGVRGRTI